MEFRAVLVTLILVGGVVALFGYGLKPVWIRVWNYLCALKAQDEEQRRDAKEIERLRIEALRELENSPEGTNNQHIGKSNLN